MASPASSSGGPPIQTSVLAKTAAAAFPYSLPRSMPLAGLWEQKAAELGERGTQAPGGEGLLYGLV